MCKQKMNTLGDIQAMLDAPTYSEIEPNLFIGSIEAVRTPSVIQSMDAVVSLVREINVPRKFFDGVLREDTRHLYIDIRDRPKKNISKHFNTTSTFIAQQLKEGKRVMVHCMAGRSRSVTIVSFYLMHTHGWDAYRALKTIKEKRPVARPNRGFITQLIESKNTN